MSNVAWEMYDEEFQNTESVPVSTNDPLPDGKYSVEILSVVGATNSEKGENYVSWQFKILEGDYTGRIIWKRSNMTDSAKPYTRGELEHIYGLKPNDPRFKFSAAIAGLPGLTGIRMGLSLWTGKSGYQNMNLGKITFDPRGANTAPAPVAPAPVPAVTQTLPGIPAAVGNPF